MLDAVIVLLSFYGLTWTFKEAELLSRPRNWIMSKSVFFFKLLSCYFCTGFHAGWMICLIHESSPSLNTLFLWGLASGAISFIIDAIVSYTYRT